MKTQGTLVKITGCIIYMGPSAIQIRQLTVPIIENNMPELPLKFTFARQQSSDGHLTMTSVRVLEALGPKDDPSYEITGECEQETLEISGFDSQDQRIVEIVAKYNPRSKEGTLISMTTQPK